MARFMLGKRFEVSCPDAASNGKFLLSRMTNPIPDVGKKVADGNRPYSRTQGRHEGQSGNSLGEACLLDRRHL